jgi:hypothetical protein
LETLHSLVAEEKVGPFAVNDAHGVSISEEAASDKKQAALRNLSPNPVIIPTTWSTK